jgi:polyisoprenyl-phosphate glycosyltransferase
MMTMQRPLISLVVPFYNEGTGVDLFYQAITKTIDSISEFQFEIVCIDDGSRDETLSLLIALADRDRRLRVIELSRNFGKEAALTAGLDATLGAAAIPLDADLQDPPELILSMLAHWKNGFDVVLARRVDRHTDSYLKRKTAELFYKIHNLFSSVQIPENVGDFRLIDRQVIEALKKLPEQQRFMKGLFAWVGFKSITVEYARQPRSAGCTKFSGWKLWNFALEGITSFSSAPLKLWTYAGGVGAICSLLYAGFVVARTLIYGVDLPGYASLMVAVIFFGCVQLLSIGMLGEYVGRIYTESKRRPIYIVRKEYGSQ